MLEAHFSSCLTQAAHEQSYKEPYNHIPALQIWELDHGMHLKMMLEAGTI